MLSLRKSVKITVVQFLRIDRVFIGGKRFVCVVGTTDGVCCTRGGGDRTTTSFGVLSNNFHCLVEEGVILNASNFQYPHNLSETI